MEITIVTQERLAHLARFTDEHLAYHEAGHAVVHHLQGGTIVRLERTEPKRWTHPAKQPTPSRVEWVAACSRCQRIAW